MNEMTKELSYYEIRESMSIKKAT